jgi:hypothetical protein
VAWLKSCDARDGAKGGGDGRRLPLPGLLLMERPRHRPRDQSLPHPKQAETLDGIHRYKQAAALRFLKWKGPGTTLTRASHVNRAREEVSRPWADASE